MHNFFQFVVGGLGFGGIYAFAALGLVLIFKTSGVVNFAFGAMATVVTLILWSLLNHAGLPFAGAWVLAMVIAMLIGGFANGVLMRRKGLRMVHLQLNARCQLVAEPLDHGASLRQLVVGHAL